MTSPRFHRGDVYDRKEHSNAPVDFYKGLVLLSAINAPESSQAKTILAQLTAITDSMSDSELSKTFHYIWESNDRSGKNLAVFITALSGVNRFCDEAAKNWPTELRKDYFGEEAGMSTAIDVRAKLTQFIGTRITIADIENRLPLDFNIPTPHRYEETELVEAW